MTAKSWSADTVAEVVSMLIVAAVVIGLGRQSIGDSARQPLHRPEAA